MPDANPLLADWTTPFGLPPFGRIRPEHFGPAFAHAMAAHRDEISSIAEAANPPTFANTIEALERAGRILERVANVFSSLVASVGGEALEAVDTDVQPLLAAHRAAIGLNQALFARVDALYAQRSSLGLASDAQRLLERIHLGFVRAGARLDVGGRARMAAIAERLAVLHTAFGQNVIHDENIWVLPLADADLEGLPDFARAAGARAAADRDMSGHVLTLSRSQVEPFLTFSARRDLRQKVYEAWTRRGAHPGAHDNRALIPEILSLRRERAQLLGYEDFASYRLADTMAATPKAAAGLLDEVWAPAKRKAELERQRLLAAARPEGLNVPLEAWDWRHYAEKVRRADYEIDEAELKAYLRLENVQAAAFDIAERLFGLSFRAIDVPVYHPDVMAYEVNDRDGHVGVLLLDHHARMGKRSGAWMSSIRDQEQLDGPVSPVILNNNNFARGQPTLLSFDDAETLFHEFGHALHGLLSRVRYPSQSGTSVRQDFVELPSQIFEHWFSLPDTLRRHARHHETGASMPDDVIQRVLAARGFNQGFGTVEYAASALIDVALHQHPDPASLDVEAFEREFLARIGIPPDIGLRHRPVHFQHLFAGGGYAAGYYSYLWSEVLDADGFEAFTQAGDPFDPAVAARLRELLSAGDTRDPMELYVAFRGRTPNTEPLIRSRGL